MLIPSLRPGKWGFPFRVSPVLPCHVQGQPAPSTQRVAMSDSDMLRTPEYLHVILNQLTIYGVMLGALARLISLALRSRAAQITALVLTKVAGVSASPVLVTGQRAYKMARPVFIPFLALSCLAGCASSSPRWVAGLQPSCVPCRTSTRRSG